MGHSDAEHVQDAINSLAAEHYYFTGLKDLLKELGKDLEKANKKGSVKEIKHALRYSRRIGKCERILAKKEKAVVEMINIWRSNLTHSGRPDAPLLEEAKKLESRIRVEAAQLVADASMFFGKLREHLLQIRDYTEKDNFHEAMQKLFELEYREF